MRTLFESVAPGTYIFPGTLAAGNSGIGEINGAGHHKGDNLAPGWHQVLDYKAFKYRYVPSVYIGFPLFGDLSVSLGGNDVDICTGGNRYGV